MSRSILLMSVVIVGLTSQSSAGMACNARGEFCGYPGWAANAFSSDDDRVPDYSPVYRTNSTAFGYIPPGNAAPLAYVTGRAYGYGTAYGYAGQGRFRR
jgi:hypothetical protein